MAAYVLDRFERRRERAPTHPKEVRRAVFAEGATGGRTQAITRAAGKLGVDPATIEGLLFADLPGERPLPRLPASASPELLALRTNLALVQGMLFRAVGIDARLRGRSRPVIRHAKLRGLICTVRRPDAGDVALEVSGPLVLFRRTLMYGRALAQLVPFLAWCDRFELRAECRVRDAAGVLVLSTRDPIFPGEPPEPYDSKLERRFAAELGKLAPDWDIVREPEPVEAAGTLIFPDFALEHRHLPNRRWRLEILGFWTPDYVADKLRRLRAARLHNLILCIDADRACADGDLPSGAAIVRFNRRIDPHEILKILEHPPRQTR